MNQDELEDTERALTRALTTWTGISLAIGGATTRAGHRVGSPGLLGFGRQTLAWGAVDGLIAATGALVRSRRGVLSAEEVERQARRLHRLLLINVVADIGYVLGGTVIALRGGRGRTTRRMGPGDGLAIVVQGGFLLILDSVHARVLGTRLNESTRSTSENVVADPSP